MYHLMISSAVERLIMPEKQSLGIRLERKRESRCVIPCHEATNLDLVLRIRPSMVQASCTRVEATDADETNVSGLTNSRHCWKAGMTSKMIRIFNL